MSVFIEYDYTIVKIINFWKQLGHLNSLFVFFSFFFASSCL